MEVSCNVLRACHNVYKLSRSILRVTSHKMNDVIALDLIKLGEQVCKVVVKAAVLAVGVDVLSEQGYILVACSDELRELGNNVLLFSASLSAAHVRHDAIGAEIVAAVHYRHPRAKLILSAHGKSLGNGVFLIVGVKYSVASVHSPPKMLGKLVNERRAEEYVNVRIAHFYVSYAMLLHHHTSADNDNEVGILRLYMLVLSDK